MHLVLVCGIILCCCLSLVACASRFVGYQFGDGRSCGYNQTDPDAEAIRSVSDSVASLAGTALRSAAGLPPTGLQSQQQQFRHVSPLPAECTEAETCVHWEFDPQTKRQSCTVIRGGAGP